MKRPDPKPPVAISPGPPIRPGSPLWEALADALATALVEEVKRRRELEQEVPGSTALSPGGRHHNAPAPDIPPEGGSEQALAADGGAMPEAVRKAPDGS